MSSSALSEAPRRELTPRQLQTVDRLAEATEQELRTLGYDELTVRSVASRAEVATATAYNYFASKEHLVAETFWRRLIAHHVPAPDPRADVSDRLVAVLRDLTGFLAADPELAAASTPALLSGQPDVQTLRLRLGRYYRSRFEDALGDDATPEVLEAVTLAYVGAVTQAGMGFLGYDEIADRLIPAVRLILRGAE